MDFAKLVAMLQQGALYFARLDQLADPFEGSLSKAEYDRWVETAAKGEAEGTLPVHWRGSYFEILMLNARRARQTMYVNCWYSGEVESEAMWRLYAADENAIAIQSTYSRLVDVLPQKLYNGCFVGVVNYVDHDAGNMPDGNSFYPVMHKRLAFAHEHEVRAVVWYGDRGHDVDPDLSGNPKGLSVPVDLSALIERIYVSPVAASWFAEAVQKVVLQNQLGIQVQKSDLARQPYL